MAIVQDWLPASQENYERILFWWKLYPLVGSPTSNPSYVYIHMYSH